MKRSEFEENEYDRFFKSVEEKDKTEGKQVTAFLKWCYDNKFMDNISDEELNFFYEENDIFLPLLSNKDMTIGIEHYGDKYRIGIDPRKQFNKTGQCSILYEFPIKSKREEKQLYKTLDMLLENKSEEAKYWYKEAGSLWYGEYLTNTK